MKLISVYLILCIILIGGCVKEQDTTTIQKTDFFQPVVTSLSGLVLGPDGHPVPNALVASGSLTTQTDEFGFFIFDNVVANGNGQMIMVDKPGFVSEVAYYLPSEQRVENMRISLRFSSTNVLRSAQNGGQLLSDQSMRIDLPPDALENDLGSPFVGDIVYQLDALHTEDDPLTSFGNPISRDLNDNPVLVSPIASIDLNIQDESGKPLNLTKPLIVEIEGESPEQVSIWKLNFTDQTWHEIETITSFKEIKLSSNGKYIVGTAFEACRLSGKIGPQHSPLENEGINIIHEENRIFHTSTNSAGEYNIYVPRNEQIRLFPLAYSSPGSFMQEILVDDVEATIQDVELGQLNYTMFSTELLACDLSHLQKGYVLIDSKQPIWISDSGKINVNLVKDNRDSIKIRAVNISDRQKSSEYALAILDRELKLPPIKICSQNSGQYVTYRMDDKRSWTHNPICGRNGNELLIYADIIDFQNPSNFQDFILSFPDDGVGIYQLEQAELYWENQGDTKYGKCQGDCGMDLKVEISMYGDQIGDVIMGSLFGIIKHPTSGEEYEVQADFNVIRSF